MVQELRMFLSSLKVKQIFFPKLGHIHNENRICATAIILITSICKVASLLL